MLSISSPSMVFCPTFGAAGAVSMAWLGAGGKAGGGMQLGSASCSCVAAAAGTLSSAGGKESSLAEGVSGLDALLLE
jgi:hypothetical protein